MNSFLFFVFICWISMVPRPSAAQERDRELYFPAYYFYAERRLMNHTIKTLRVKNLDDCEYLCYMEDACVSLNIKNKNPGSTTHECELNNSTHMEHGEYLKTDPVYYYRGAKNNCGNSRRRPCQNNATCQSGFTYKGYRCSCSPGFEGEHCEKDINECTKSTPVCDDNEVCNNTHGGYNCTCKPGFTGDGHNCTDIDECERDPHKCHENAKCTNTKGSYNCSCKRGYIGDGRNCEVDPCHGYKILNSSDRNLKNTEKGSQCDDHISESELGTWYRFQGAAGTRLPTACPQRNKCHTSFPGWLKLEGKPLPQKGVERTGVKVCFRYYDTKCCHQSIRISVKKCDLYFVYQLKNTPGCPCRYCGTE